MALTLRYPVADPASYRISNVSSSGGRGLLCRAEKVTIHVYLLQRLSVRTQQRCRVESSRVRLTHTRQRLLVLLRPFAECVHTSRVESSPKILDESRAFMSHVSFLSVGFLEPGVTVAVFRYEINLEMSVLLVEGHQTT